MAAFARDGRCGSWGPRAGRAIVAWREAGAAIGLLYQAARSRPAGYRLTLARAFPPISPSRAIGAVRALCRDAVSNASCRSCRGWTPRAAAGRNFVLSSARAPPHLVLCARALTAGMAAAWLMAAGPPLFGVNEPLLRDGVWGISFRRAAARW